MTILKRSAQLAYSAIIWAKQTDNSV